MYLDDKFVPNEAISPMNAPSWTLAGYNGSLKTSIENSIGKPSQEKITDMNDEDDEVEEEKQ